MKKIITLLFTTIILTFGVTSFTYAESTSNTSASNPDYYIPNYEPELEFKVDGNYVYFEWDKAKEEQFKYYKFVYSEDSAKPVYPDSTTKFIGSKISENQAKVKYKKGYWRVCHVYRGYYEEWEKTKYRACSNVVHLEEKNEELSTTTYKKADTTKHTKEKKEVSVKKYEKKHNLSSTLKKKSEGVVGGFKKKLNNSKLSNEAKVIKINTIISKLNAIKKTKPSLVALIEYLVERLEILREEYQDDFSDIEKLFDF